MTSLKSVLGAALIGAIYGSWVPIMGQWQIMNWRKSPSIRSEYQLDQIVREETKNISPKSEKFVLGILAHGNQGRSFKLKDGVYVIEVGGIAANRYTVRHELYHIYSGDNDSFLDNELLNRLRYIYYREPRAIFYDIIDKKF